MKANIVLFCLVMSFLGCSDDDPISAGSNNDDLLKTQLVGSWNLGIWYRTVYRGDNTYCDSIFYRSSVDTNQYLLDIVTKGKYSIANGVLQRTHVNWFFADSTRYRGGISTILLSQEIEVVGNRLLLKPVDVLSPTSLINFELWGTWTLTTWSYHRSDGPPSVVYEGRQKYVYEFKKDSSRFRYGWEYLDGNPFPNPSFTSEFTYNPPLLNMLGPGWYNVRVQFKHGLMYWYYDFGPTELTRNGPIGKTFPPNKALNLTERADYKKKPTHPNESLIAARVVYLQSSALLRRLVPVR